MEAGGMTAMAATRQPILSKPSVLLTVLKEQLHIQHVQLRSSDKAFHVYIVVLLPQQLQKLCCA